MKKLILLLIFLVGVSVSFAQTARIQIIHNAADPAAQEVDVYVNGTLARDNFAFRTGMDIWIFILAGFISLSIALFTVSYQSIRSASANPVETLRYE